MKIDDMQRLASRNWQHTEDDHRRMTELLQEMGLDPGNFYQELEMSSRYVNTHRDISYTNAIVNLHSHNYVEIIYCRSSSDVEYLIGSDRYRLRKGDIVYVPAGVSHRPIMPEALTIPYERDVVWISTEFLNRVITIYPESSTANWSHATPIRTAGTSWEFLGEIFRTGVLEEEQKKPGWEAAVAGTTLLILTYLNRIHSERSAGAMVAEKPELTDRITAFIEANFASPIALDDLSRQFYVSSSTISHQFKQKMGVSLYRYITQRRLIAAKALIAKNIPMEQISEQVGFTDYSAFYRAFKQEFGISPKQYRQHQM